MPMTWNDQADAKLLIGILHLTTQKINYDALAEWMGPECTKIAVQRRIQRLREQMNKDFDISGSVDAAAGEGSSAPATPEKRKRGRPAGKGKGSKKARGEKEGDACDAGDADNEEGQDA